VTVCSRIEMANVATEHTYTLQLRRSARIEAHMFATMRGFD